MSDSNAMSPIATQPCGRFVGRREWGIYVEDWRPCQNCQWTKATHESVCDAVLSIAGADYRCELTPPHNGWGHSNKEAQAIWDGDRCMPRKETDVPETFQVVDGEDRVVATYQVVEDG